MACLNNSLAECPKILQSAVLRSAQLPSRNAFTHVTWDWGKWDMARKQETARVAWGAAAACTLLAILDALVGDRAILIVLLVLGPLFAATRATPRQTAWVAAYTVVLAVVLGAADDIFGDVQHLVRVGAVLGVGMSAVWIAWLRTGLEREQRRAAFLFDAGLEFDKSLDYKTSGRDDHQPRRSLPRGLGSGLHPHRERRHRAAQRRAS